MLHGDLDAVERARGVGRRDDDDPLDARVLRAPARPSRPFDGRAAGAGASASRSSCACRGRRPSRLLRGRSPCQMREWLGRQDSNLGSRDQNPLPYRLATPQGDANSSGGRGRDRRARGPRRSTTAMITAHFTIQREDHGDHGQELRGGEDPEDLADDVRSGSRGRRARRAPRRSRARSPSISSASCEKRTTIASAAAIQSASRVRRSWSQRPALLEPCSTACGESLSTRSTVPRWCRQPGPPDAAAARAARPSRAPRGGRARRRSGRLR